MPTFNFDFTEFYNGLVSLTKRIADTIYHVKDNSIEAKYLSLITLLKDRPNLRNSSEIEKTDKLIQENLGAIREVYNSNKKTCYVSTCYVSTCYVSTCYVSTQFLQ